MLTELIGKESFPENGKKDKNKTISKLYFRGPTQNMTLKTDQHHNYPKPQLPKSTQYPPNPIVQKYRADSKKVQLSYLFNI